MRKIVASLLVVLFVSCSDKKDFNSLAVDTDKTEDVEKKVGKPDTSFALGEGSEFWLYKNDTVLLMFTNNVLVNKITARDRASDEENKRAMEARETAMIDSIAAMEKYKQDSIVAAAAAAESSK